MAKKKKFDVGGTGGVLDGIDEVQSNQRTPESRRVAAVTGKAKQMDAKGRMPKSIRLPPDLIENVNRIADYEGYARMDLWHWLVEVGVAAYHDGQRPHIVEEAIKRSIDI